MRNLKRVLSLSLASIMLLGMMVIGSSAASDYSDVDYDNDNVEAIEVLNAIGVMNGDLDSNGELAGTFRPGDEVKRSEMARIMAFLMDLDYDYYIGANPFDDMVGHWAEKYAAACYANGIISGRTTTPPLIYDPDSTVTAVEAASMLMRALGYFQNPAVDYPDGFEISTIRQAGRITLFNKVDVRTNEPMTRNDVAQLILNTLQSGMVDVSTRNSVDVVVGDAQVTIGSSNYVYRVSRNDAIGNAINTDKADAGNSVDGMEGSILDLGEQLYQGELKLAKYTQDVYGRPARTWTFKGTEVGTYAKTELLQGEPYTVAVKGRDIYDLLGQSAIRDNELCVYVDGHLNGHDNDASYNVTKSLLVRANNADLNSTGRGVLTEVYLDNELERITIASINTYLAQANSDYNESSETISLTVYNDASGTTKVVDVEDIPAIVDMVKDDWVLVNWADESSSVTDKVVQRMLDVEIMEDVVVTGFSSSVPENSGNYNLTDIAGRRVTDITVDGNTYKNNEKAYYKANTLNDYSTDRLVDKTYTLYLDQYGYFIGAELYSGKAQYVFITGYDRPESAISTSTAKANAIFTDGTMGTIDVNVKDTNDNIGTKDGYNQWLKDEPHDEMWYTYTVRNNVYTLTPVKGWTRTFATAPDTIINCSNVRLVPSAATTGAYSGAVAGGSAYTGTGNAYGEDDSVYITVSMGPVDMNATTSRGGANNQGVTDIDGVYTGVQDVKLVYQEGDWAHAVYDPDNNYIIAAVVRGEAEGVVDNYAYIRSGAKAERVEVDANGEYTHYWTVDVIMNGELTSKTIKSRFNDTAGKLVQYTVQELIMDADGYVTTIRTLPNALNSSGNEVDDDAYNVVDKSDKVYTNYDYLTNPLKIGKPNSTDLADYNVYDIDVHNTAYGASAIGQYTVTHNDTQYRYSNLTVQGNTIHFDVNPASGEDIGLAVKRDAPAFIYHWVNGERKYEEVGSVEQAFRLITDADYDSTNNKTNLKQFSGRVVAALDSRGVAEWVLFIDNVPPQGKNVDTTVTYPGITLASNMPIADVQKYLYDGNDVIINGSWEPSDLKDHPTQTLIIPENRVLTVLGDLKCYQNGNSGKDLTIGANGTGTTMGKLNVPNGTYTPYRQDIYFPVTAKNLDFFTGNSGGAYEISNTVTVTNNFTISYKNGVDVVSGGRLSVSGSILLGTGNDGSGKLYVNGEVYTKNTTNVDINVLSANSLHVSGTATGNGTTGTITIGNGSVNGNADIAKLVNVDLVIDNKDMSVVPKITDIDNASSITITKGKLLVEGTINTDEIEIEAGQTLAFGSEAKIGSAIGGFFVNGAGDPLSSIAGAEITPSAKIESSDTSIKVTKGGTAAVSSDGVIDSNADADTIQAILENAATKAASGGGTVELSISNLSIGNDTLEIPDGVKLTITGSVEGTIALSGDGEGTGEVVLENVNVSASGNGLILEEGTTVSGSVTVAPGGTLEIGKINEDSDSETADLIVKVGAGADVSVDLEAESVEITFNGQQTKAVVIEADEQKTWNDDGRAALGEALQAIFPNGAQVDLDDVATGGNYNTSWGMIGFVLPDDVDNVLIALYADAARSQLIAMTNKVTGATSNGGIVAVTRDLGGAWEYKDTTLSCVSSERLKAGTYYYDVYEADEGSEDTLELDDALEAIEAGTLSFSGSFTLSGR